MALNKKKLRHLILRCLVSLIVIAAIGAIYITSRFNRPAVKMADLEQLSVGMSKDKVRQILGEPTTVRGKQEWGYSRMLSWTIVYIYFDSKENFKEYRYDY